MFSGHFETFSTGRNCYITVIKEPIQQINDSSSTNYYGYGPDSSSNTEITYIPVSGVFPCIPVYSKSMNSKEFTETKFFLDTNKNYAKVKEDCRDFINDGKTERVIIDGKSFNLDGDEAIQNFWGIRYYYFGLTPIK
ncbi:MAG: hypothetical protein AABY22_05315 [Nanoarchaeota archaeon]